MSARSQADIIASKDAKRAAAKAHLARMMGARYPEALHAQMTTAPILPGNVIETPEFIEAEVKKAKAAVAAVNQTRV